MGRFYKAPDPNFVKPEDFLYKAPWEEVKAGMKYQDEKIEGIQKQHQEYLQSLMTLKRNSKDPSEQLLYDLKYKKYSEGMGNIVNSIMADPLSWRNHVGSMNNIGTSLKGDMMRGDLFYMQKREEARQAFEQTYKGKMDPVWYEKLLKNRMDEVSQGLSSGNMKTQFRDDAVYDKKNIPREFLDFIKDKKGDIKSVASYSDNGKVAISKNGVIEEISEKEVSGLFNQFVQGADIKPYLEFADREGLNNFINKETGEVQLYGSDLDALRNQAIGVASYRQEKIDTSHRDSITAETAAANSRALFQHNLDEKAKQNEAVRAAKAAASASSGAIGSIDQVLLRGNTPQEEANYRAQANLAINRIIGQHGNNPAELNKYREELKNWAKAKGYSNINNFGALKNMTLTQLSDFTNHLAVNKNFSTKDRAGFLSASDKNRSRLYGNSFNESDVAMNAGVSIETVQAINKYFNAGDDKGFKGWNDYSSMSNKRVSIIPRGDYDEASQTIKAGKGKIVQSKSLYQHAKDLNVKGSDYATQLITQKSESKDKTVDPFNVPGTGTQIEYGSGRISYRIENGNKKLVYGVPGYYQGNPVIYEFDATSMGVNLNKF